MATDNAPVKLESLGYNQHLEDSRLQLGVSAACVARVTAEHKGAYEIAGVDGESHAVVSGKLMQNAVCRDDYPAVGDWVVIRDENGETKVIEGILPRQSALRKKYGGKDKAQLIAANVDVAFIVESMDRDYNVNRFERYIVLAREGGVRPVIVMNKCDIITEAELSARVEQLRKRFHDVDILPTSTLTDSGLDGLSRYIQKGATYCFLGSSGVGKSSLINKMLGQERIATKEIGLKTGRGRHTTTVREMYFTSGGGIIIDNPGSREVGMLGFDDGVKEVFVDIEDLAAHCRFKDCRHDKETGCAVLGALESGDIDAAQYDNYMKLRKEAEHYEMSGYDRRQKDKKFGKFIKNAKEDFKKFNP